MNDARTFGLLGLLALAAGAFAFTRTRRGGEVGGAVLEGAALAVRGALDEVVVTAKKVFAWAPPAAAAAFASLFARARALYQLPELLLERVAYQESRFRADIIEGRTISSAGALGLMQIVPRWHPGVDPLNPSAAIDYAGRYLRRLRDRFGSWRLALAAYNWGEGNVANALRDGRRFASWPSETRNYVQQVAADVPAVAAEEAIA